LAGGLLGWLVDRLVGTAPWGLIVCLILGFAAGMLNLLRASGAVKPVRPGGK
jgi:ATP synthase protein I